MKHSNLTLYIFLTISLLCVALFVFAILVTAKEKVYVLNTKDKIFEAQDKANSAKILNDLYDETRSQQVIIDARFAKASQTVDVIKAFESFAATHKVKLLVQGIQTIENDEGEKEAIHISANIKGEWRQIMQYFINLRTFEYAYITDRLSFTTEKTIAKNVKLPIWNADFIIIIPLIQ